MSYRVLAQKYRPESFDDVVGQEAVARALKNSIDRERVANAYIFCGPRGVGKTSVARIVAKTLNCKDASAKGPCGKCASCREITTGTSMDVLEIDGASNRGIDEIRALRENVKFLPAAGKFKIYIIDEVHMLTTEAFNALLKTLEEPPAHVKFIFATTEAHKVIATIMSRCQRFDFKRIPPKVMFDRLVSISKKEKIEIDDKALLVIARAADGSMRDALVILDQIVSFADKKIQAGDVLDLLGMIHKDVIFALSDGVITGDPKKTAATLDELINSGKDPIFIASSLIAHFRDIMVLKAVGAPTSDMAFTDEELSRMNGEKVKLSLEEILYILQNLTNCVYTMKGTHFPRAPLEICLIRLAMRENIMSVPEIIAKLNGLGNTVGAIHESPLHLPKHDPLGGTPPFPAGSSKLKRDEPTHTAGQNGLNGFAEISDIDSNETKVHWEAVLNYVRNKKMSVFTFLAEGKLVEFGRDKIAIGFAQDHAFNKEVLETDVNKDLLEEAFTSVLGKTPKLEFKILDFLGKTAKNTLEAEKKRAEAKEALKPVIEKAIDIFGGQVIRDIEEAQ